MGARFVSSVWRVWCVCVRVVSGVRMCAGSGVSVRAPLSGGRCRWGAAGKGRPLPPNEKRCRADELEQKKPTLHNESIAGSAIIANKDVAFVHEDGGNCVAEGFGRGKFCSSGCALAERFQARGGGEVNTLRAPRSLPAQPLRGTFAGGVSGLQASQAQLSVQTR